MRRWAAVLALVLVVLAGVAIGVSAYHAGYDHGLEASGRVTNGAGIAPEVLGHVFDRFVRGTESRGAGLGLAIAKSLVQAHGGEITAESPPGGGTRMGFVLPVERRAFA